MATTNETEVKPGRKILWFTAIQMAQLEELKELTGLDNSKVMRRAMDEMLKRIKGE